ncbi:MAG: organomercurial lyase [Candidatus Hermodarchaeota archaeon]
MKSIDSELTPKERKILIYLLSEYKKNHHFPDIEETKRALNVHYDDKLEEKLRIQFIRRGFPQVGMTQNQEDVFNHIIERYSLYDHLLTIDEIKKDLQVSSQKIEEIIAKLDRLGLITRKEDLDDRIIPRISKIGYDHKVILKDGRLLKPIEAACVIDALGLPFTYNQDATVISKDPISGQEIKIEIKDEKITYQQPKNLIVYLGSQCSTTLFFTSDENLNIWENQHPNQQGNTINMNQALILARKLFENRLDIDYIRSCEISFDKDQKNIEWLEIPSDNNQKKCCN